MRALSLVLNYSLRIIYRGIIATVLTILIAVGIFSLALAGARIYKDVAIGEFKGISVHTPQEEGAPESPSERRMVR